MAEALLTALGGRPIIKRVTRGDLCLDIANLDVTSLLALVKDGQFITRASSVLPKIDYLTDQETGFTAGKYPCYLTAYDKVDERMGKADSLYLAALIERRWGGSVPQAAARIEYQLNRPWLRNNGIDSPEDFLNHRGTLSEKLTSDWFRITATRVERRNKHQSRAGVHPLWAGIQEGFVAIFGPPQGLLEPLSRNHVRPIELARQGRGCLLSCLLQMRIEISSYQQFVAACSDLLFGLFPKDAERAKFLEMAAERTMEYEVS